MRFIPSAMFLSALLACSPAGDTAPGISVDGAYIIDPAAGRDVAAGGMVIRATGMTSRLLSADSPSAERIELHTHVETEGVMQMRQVEAIDLPDGEDVALKRGGHHLMLFGFDADLTPGDTIEMTLTFEMDEGEETQRLSVPVVDLSDIN